MTDTVFSVTDSVAGSVNPIQHLWGDFTRPISSLTHTMHGGDETSGFLQNDSIKRFRQTAVSPPAWWAGPPIVLEIHSVQSSDLLLDAMRRIFEAQALPFDWDSYGGIGATINATNRALSLIFDLWEYGLLLDDQHFDVVPVSTGGIQLEWIGTHGEIEIEIDAVGKLHSLIELADGTYEESPGDSPLDWAEIRNQVLRIVGQSAGA
ncbi:MAG: hypothetical protein ACR2OE_00345 [Thermomicrobiales bacterium]